MDSLDIYLERAVDATEATTASFFAMLGLKMTIGIGTDYVDVQELRQSDQQQPERYVNRIFTGFEISYAMTQSDPLQCLAGRLAAKEACMKALGTGWTDEIDWQHIEVRNEEETGRPFLLMYGGAASLASRLGVLKSFVTISHTPDSRNRDGSSGSMS